MEVSAKLNYLRIAPRKVRLLADLIRGKTVKESQVILSFVVKKGSLPLLKLLNQAAASAINNFQLDSGNLYISKVAVDEGPKYKRWRPRARGQTYEIQKKSSHITIVLEEKVKTKRKAKTVRKMAKVGNRAPQQRGGEGKEDKSRAPAMGGKEDKSSASKPKIERGIRRIFRRKAF